MEKKKITEIKKGEEGHGLLIEHDGYISIDCGDNKKLFESFKNRNINENTEQSDFTCPYPFIVDAVFQRSGAENANGRIYPESVLKREVSKYQKLIDERYALAELNHPSESVIDLSRVAINVVELHWVGNTLVGKIEIITSPGFRKYGVISCEGDQTANLLLSGYKIGLSSRGLGSVTNKMGVLYVGDDFELVCFDVVSNPSTKNAWICQDGVIPNSYLTNENQVNNTKTKLIEKLENFNNWLND
jgi:hypothetical protein